jgi:hypothetical protein
MSSDDFKNIKREYPNYGNHMLDLSTRTKMYLRGQLHDKSRTIRNYTSFFKPNGALPADGFAEKTVKSILTESTTQLTGQSIPIGERKKRRR